MIKAETFMNVNIVLVKHKWQGFIPSTVWTLTFKGKKFIAAAFISLLAKQGDELVQFFLKVLSQLFSGYVTILLMDVYCKLSILGQSTLEQSN